MRHREVEMKLNCDMGEGFGSWTMGCDPLVMPHIHMANIACGFHASDPLVMENTVKLAQTHGVSIGAHPGYPDLMGFGRRSMKCSSDELRTMIIYQVGALAAICEANGSRVAYVKPHGALYNDMMRDDELMRVIIQALASMPQPLKLVVQATARNQHYTAMAAEQGVELLFEAFADRGYDDEGYLLPRTEPNAVFKDQLQILERVRRLSSTGTIRSASGKELALNPDTLCVHGDNDDAVAAIATIRRVMDNG